MPTYRVTTWSEVEAPAMVLGRDGRPRYVWAAMPIYNADDDWIDVTSREGTFSVSPTAVAMVIDTADWEAIGMLVNGLGARPVRN